MRPARNGAARMTSRSTDPLSSAAIAMVALSLRQPWAELVLRGVKTIETRTWKSSFLGEFYIHAAKQIDFDCCSRFGINPQTLVTGAIVGRATIVSRIDYVSEKMWRAGEKRHCVAEPLATQLKKVRYGYVLRDIVRLAAPVPCAGKLNFFPLPQNMLNVANAAVGKSAIKSAKSI